MMIFEELTKEMCSSFKITLHSHKNSKAERKITRPNPEIGSDHLAEMRMHACLLARNQQGISEGIWHSCNESLYLFPVQLMHLKSTYVSILATLSLLHCFAAQTRWQLPSTEISPGIPLPACAGGFTRQCYLVAEINRSIIALSATTLSALQC